MSGTRPAATVAVITRTRDRPRLLPRAAASIGGQTWRDLVWVLVNDAGDPVAPRRAAEAVSAAGLPVVVVDRPESRGMEAASNDGIARVDSRYIVIHDDDDSWEPEFLERMVGFLGTRPDLLGAVCYATRVVEEITGDDVRVLAREPYNDKLRAIYLADMVEYNRFPPISFLFRREAYDAVGGFDERLPVLGDWDFNLRLLMRGEIGLLRQALANYHLRYGTPDGEAQYGNTVTLGLDRIHPEIDCRYRNHKLREDLAAGRVGLGLLLMHGRQLAHISSRTQQWVDQAVASLR